MALTNRALADISLFLLLSMAGIALGNVVFLYLSLLPLFYVIISFTYRKPSGIKVIRTESSAVAWVDQSLEVSLNATVDSGRGIVTIADVVPEHFELKQGNNFHVFWKGKANIDSEITYEVRCTRRGMYELGPVKIEAFHHSWHEQTEFGSGSSSTELTVKLKPLSLKKMRDPRLLSKMPTPMGAQSRLGMKTNDFLDIRPYSHGDPYRSINWKATARLSAPGNATPLVNEYEKEGKKTVYIFVDAGTWMGLGSSVDNVFEYALQAASGISRFYLEREMKVGVYVYHGDESILPDTGKRQAFNITGSLLKAQVSDTITAHSTLKKAVLECQGHLAGINPLFIIITMVNKNNAREIIDGVKAMHWYSADSRRPQILAVHIAGYEATASGEYENTAAKLLSMDSLPYMKAIRNAGALVVPWNPRTQSLNKLMVLGFRRRW